ncbi:MAG: hypothetical protein COB02_08675 [Candidatus Cloacimonadota bacterium]|nr:MAG: hypothetical protein COB02_08675 [Candidatus Cloacimonadota bacterium]
MKIKNKVLAYIFRDNNGVKELLVFDHQDYPEVNSQVIAGTVEEGENFELAISREIYEESGLMLDKLSYYLGQYTYYKKDADEVQKRYVYVFNTSDLLDKWIHTVSVGQEDKGLVFEYYWLAVNEAQKVLVSEMGNYLPEYFFESLNENNLMHLKKWLCNPHVKEFWDDRKAWEQLQIEYISKISSKVVRPFIIYFQDIAIGYIQFYWASKVGNGWWENYPDDIVGIDIYIGEKKLINKGHGTKIIKEFMSYLQNNFQISKIVIAPSVNNFRAISCYEKCGFVVNKEIITPDGKELLMEYLCQI